jgi:acyl-CoA synthetase (AMP-forming)/AMP-acid ligase II
MSTFDNIAAVLRHRGRSNPKKAAFMVLEAKGKEMATITWDKLASRAEKVAQVIRDKSGLYRGDRVALVYRDCEVIDFAIALFGCFIAGVVAVPINKQEDFQELTTILAATQAHLALTTDTNLKVFHRELSLNKLSWPRGVEWWKTNEFGSFHPKKKEEAPPLQAPDLAYVEYSKSPTGDLRGVVISHRTVMHQMASLSAIITAAPSSMRDKYVPERDRQGKPVMPRSNGEVLVTYLDPRQAIGLILGILLAVYYGNTTVWCPTGAVATPGLLAHIITRYRATLLLADYPGLKTVAYNYQNDPMSTRGKKHHVDFSTIKLCLVDCLTVDSEFHEILADRWLRPLGNKRSQEVLTPMLCLPEHGGMVISMKDWLGGQERISGLGVTVEDAEENDLTEVLLDQEALKSNEIVVVATGADVPKRAADPATVRVGSFFYPLVDATLAVVDPETSRLCSSTTVGEIWIDSPSMSACYWLLPRHTDTIFHARPYFLEPNTGETQVFEQEFLRTGLLGFVIQGRIFVLGLYEDRLRQKVEWVEDAQEITEYRYHYVTHLVNTIMRNVPKIFDCSAFDVYVNKEHLPVVLLESPSASTSPLTPSGPARILDNDLLEALAEKVIEALLENHQVRVYSVLICAPDTLPRVSRNGREEIGNMLCRKVFERGSLPTVMVKFAVERAVLNLPVGADPVGGIWSRLATERRALDLQLESKQYSGVDVRATCLDERTSTNLADFGSIVEIFQWRASRQVEELALLSIDSRGKEGKAISWRKLDLKISATASHLKNKLRLKSGEQVILMYTHSEEFLFVVHACFALGITAIPIAPIDPSRLSEDVPALLSIIADYKVKHILVNNETNTALQSKFVNQHLKQSALALKITLPQICNTAKPTKQTKGCRENGFVMEQSWLRLGYPALVWTYWSPDQRRTCVTLDHAALMGCCKVQKETCQMPASRPMLGCIRSTSGLGFLHSFLMGMFVGCATYLMSPVDFAANPLFLSQVIARYKMKDCYVTPQSMEHLMQAMQGKGPSLHELKNLMIAFDGRVAPHAFPRMRQQLGPSGLDASALNATYGHVVNPMLATRSYMCVEPIEVCLDTRALRAGYIRFTKPSEDPSGLVLHDSGMVPVSTQIAIVNPETCTLCRNGEFGEIWVASEASAIGFHESADPFDIERFNGQIADVETRNTYIRTGDLGFLHTVARPVSRGQGLAELQTLFVLGCIGETFEVNGLNHFPMDIESTVERCHRAIARGGSAVFQAGDQVVLLVEVLRTTHLSGVVPVIVNAVLDEHQIIVDKVAFCARGDFPRSRLREKQRGRILASWIKKQLKTCIVYNVRNGERHLDSADTMNMAQEPLGAIGEIMDGLEDDDQEGPPQGAAAMYGKSIPGSGHSRPERGTARLSMSSSVQGLPTDATQAELEAARALRTGTSSLAGDAETSARPSHDQSSFDDFGRPTEEHQSAVHQGFLKLKPIRSANPEARGNGEPRLSYEADDRDLSWLHSPQSDAGLQAYLEGSGGISSDLATPDSRTEYGIGR